MLFSEVIRILAILYHINLTIMAATFIINMPQMFARAGETWQNGLTYLPRRLNTCQIIVFKLETWVAAVVQPVTPAGDQVYGLRVYMYRWTERERAVQRERERRYTQRERETESEREGGREKESERDRQTGTERDRYRHRDRRTESAELQSKHVLVLYKLYIVCIYCWSW